VLCDALDAAGPEGLPHRARRRLAVPALLEPGRRPESRASGSSLSWLARRDFVGVERSCGRARARAARTPSCCCGAAQRRGGPRCSTGRPSRLARGRHGDARACTSCSSPASPSGDLRPRPGAQHRLLHGRGVRGLRPRARRADRRRRALRRPARALRAPLPAVGFALNVERLHIALAGRGARHGRSAADEASRHERERPHDRGAARRAVHDTLDLLDRLGIDTEEVRENDRKLLFEDIGIVTMRPSDVPTYVEAGAADLGITGKDVLLSSSPSARSTSCSTSATAAARWCWRARPARTAR
jgi:hypothetical protein